MREMPDMQLVPLRMTPADLQAFITTKGPPGFSGEGLSVFG